MSLTKTPNSTSAAMSWPSDFDGAHHVSVVAVVASEAVRAVAGVAAKVAPSMSWPSDFDGAHHATQPRSAS